jgi:hypothetical protein
LDLLILEIVPRRQVGGMYLRLRELSDELDFGIIQEEERVF